MLEELLASKKDDLIEMLMKKLDVSPEQADGFLSKIFPMIQGLISGGKLDPSALLNGNTSALKDGLDLDSLGELLGGGKEKAERGVDVVAAPISESLGKLDNPMDMLSGLIGGDTDGLLKKGLGGLGKMFN